MNGASQRSLIMATKAKYKKKNKMPEKKPVAFCTNISDPYYHSMGADKLIKSAKYFHPDIPFCIYTSEDVAAMDLPPEILMPFIMNKLIDEYEMVIRFDADSMLTGPVTEILEATDYDFVGVRNNNDYGKAGKDKPITQFNVGVNDYLNAGLLATTSKTFLADWMDACLSFGLMLPFGEQTVLNGIKRKYKTLIVDSIESNCHYGVSCLYGKDESDEATHWDSWKDIYEINGGLYLKNKVVKVIHHAGGFKEDKLGFYMFNDSARRRLVEIIS